MTLQTPRHHPPKDRRKQRRQRKPEITGRWAKHHRQTGLLLDNTGSGLLSWHFTLFAWNTHGWIVLFANQLLFFLLRCYHLFFDWGPFTLSEWLMFILIDNIYSYFRSKGAHIFHFGHHTFLTKGSILFWQGDQVPYFFSQGYQVPYFFDKGTICFWQGYHTFFDKGTMLFWQGYQVPYFFWLGYHPFLTRVPSTILFWQEYHTFWQGYHTFDKGTKYHTFLTWVPHFFDKGTTLSWQGYPKCSHPLIYSVTAESPYQWVMNGPKERLTSKMLRMVPILPAAATWWDTVFWCAGCL